jgi:hypothetical protein
MLLFSGRHLRRCASLPPGTHNAQPYRDGVLFNDTNADRVRFAGRDPNRNRAFKVPPFPREQLEGVGIDTSRVARPDFGRGLCVIGEGLIAAGSSPSTIAVHDLDANATAMTINLSRDVRNAIHGLEVWPYA